MSSNETATAIPRIVLSANWIMRHTVVALFTFVLIATVAPVAAQPSADPTPPSERESPDAVLPDAVDEDARAAEQLRSVFNASDDLRSVEVAVDDGVARLWGTVPTAEVHERIVDIAQDIDGIVYVDDELTEPVSLSDRVRPLGQRLEAWLIGVGEKVPLIALSLLALVAFGFLGRFVSRRDRLFSALVKREMLRDLARRVTMVAFVIIGVLVALEILDAMTLVGSVLGAAGVLGLALGFAFRDIIENYFASFLLATRRPFELGDSVKIGDLEGKVVRLTTRETVLMTFDGNHLSLPNATVFKANVLNYSRNPRRRFDVTVTSGVDMDLCAVRTLGLETLAASPGTLKDPAPHSVIEQLADSSVVIRFYGWVDQREVDFQKARSEALRRVKSALEHSGVDMPGPVYNVLMTSSDAADRAAPGDRPRAAASETVDVSVNTALDDHIHHETSVDKENNLLFGAARIR